VPDALSVLPGDSVITSDSDGVVVVAEAPFVIVIVVDDVVPEAVMGTFSATVY